MLCPHGMPAFFLLLSPVSFLLAVPLSPPPSPPLHAPDPYHEVRINDEIIDILPSIVQQSIAVSYSEYFFLSNGSLFQVRLAPSREVKLVSTSVACFCVDSELTLSLWWISSETGNLCSHKGCEPGTDLKLCTRLEVREATFLLTTAAGFSKVYDRSLPLRATLLSKDDEIGVFCSHPRFTVACVISLLLISLLAANGLSIPRQLYLRRRRRRGQLGSLLENSRGGLPGGLRQSYGPVKSEVLDEESAGTRDT